MPGIKGSGITVLVTLECNHTRRTQAPLREDYYCMRCDEHKTVKEHKNVGFGTA